MQQANCHSNRSRRSHVILLVEDHDIYRDVVRAAMGKYLPEDEMVEADCVEAALRMLQLRTIDLMVVDMTLPDGSAIDLVEQAGHFIEQGVRVILFSSHSSADMLPVLSRGDVHGYVSKEQGLKALAEAITEIKGTKADVCLASVEHETFLESSL